MTPTKLTVLIPVFNEIKTLEEIIKKVEDIDFFSLEKEIIIIDDCSTDGTTELIKTLESKNKYKIFYHSENQGKGAALRTGLQHVTGDIVIIQDADLEYDPSDYVELLKLILDNKADVVYGSRLSGAKPSRSFMFSHLLGNKFLTLLTNLLYDTTITDMETCYKAFKVETLKGITIKSNKFDFEPEITAKILKRKYKLYEVPISYYGRDYAEGKKITWKDGFDAMRALIWFRFFD